MLNYYPFCEGFVGAQFALLYVEGFQCCVLAQPNCICNTTNLLVHYVCTCSTLPDMRNYNHTNVNLRLQIELFLSIITKSCEYVLMM